MKTPRRQFYRTLTMTSIMLFVTVVAVEAALHLAASIFPAVTAILYPDRFSASLPDADLLFKGNPDYPGVDKNGFRNVSVPSHVKLISIGDSHTWGTSVELDQAWPQVLGRLTSCDVYNMSLSGYGPLHYALLAEQAVRYTPDVILTGIYFGNDLYDNWQMYLRHPDKYPVPESLLQPAILRERENPLSRDVEEFFGMGQPADDSAPTGLAQSTKYFLSEHSSVYAFMRAFRNRLLETRQPSVLDNSFKTAVAALTPRQLEYASVFEGAEWKTIFTSRYREAVVNEDDPRIRVGYWLAEWAVQRIADLTKRAGIRTVFVLLPTKESAFFQKVHDPSPHRYYEKLTSEEARYRARLTDFLDRAGSHYVDMTPILQSSAVQPYFENADGHPNPVGHRIIAERLAADTGVCR
jgi:lysophospholipase L1-like esterase